MKSKAFNVTQDIKAPGYHRPDVYGGCVGSLGEGGNCADNCGVQSEQRLPVRRLSVGKESAVEERQTRNCRQNCCLDGGIGEGFHGGSGTKAATGYYLTDA